MRTAPRAILCAALAAVLMLLALQSASARDIQATPVTEPESEAAPTMRNSSLVQPMMIGDPIVWYGYPESIGQLPDADYFLVIGWDLTDVDFELPDNEVSLRYSYELTNSEAASFSTSRLSDTEREHSYSFLRWNVQDANMNLNCIANEGRLRGTLNFRITNNVTQETLFAAEPHAFDIPCSATVTPTPPATQISICGPNNDEMNIPQQPNGVSVDTGAWADGERIVTYSAADWAVFREGFQTSYTFTDDQPCTAEAEITGPTSLYLLEPGSQMTITGNYDVSSIWPGEDGLVARIEGAFETNRIGAYFGMPLPISSPVDSFSIQTRFQFDWLVEYCPDPEYAGEFEIFFDIVFSRPTGPNSAQEVWRYEQTLEVPCTVAVTPLDVSIDNEICGNVDERILVPQQQGIAGHSITWNGNIATITYQAATAYEIVGGPFSVTVNGEPCLVTPVPPSVVTEVCGPNNDVITVPDQPEGVIIEDAGWVDNERTFEFIPAGGYAFPDDVETTHTVTDRNTSCLTDAPVSPVQTQVCGPDNDQLTIPPQPEGVTLADDSGWSDGTRTITFAIAPGSVTDGETAFTFTDDAIPCSITLAVHLDASDDGSLAGSPWQLYAPVAAQAFGNDPFAEGPVDRGNIIVVNDLIAGSYRLVVTAEGYEPIDTVLTLIEGEEYQEIRLDAIALQPVETPTAQPTQDVSPTPIPTEQPLNPTQEPPGVSGLPSTGSGSGVGFGWVSVAMIALVLLTGGVRRTARS